MPTHPSAPTIRPVEYRPEFEHLEDDEAQTAQELLATLRKIQRKVSEDEGHAFRSVHAKSHGVLRGRLTVRSDLAAPFAHGVFRPGATYDVQMRLSTTPGDLLDDRVSTPRGLAVKLLKVTGPRTPGNEERTDQDFLLVNGPVFSAPNARRFLKNLKLLAATTDVLPGGKRALSAALRGFEATIEAFGGESETIKALGGQPLTHPLGERYFTQVPMLYGPYIAKLSIVPLSPQMVALAGHKLDLGDQPNGLREAVADYFRRNDAAWEVRAQLCTDIERMPIEDASVSWPEELSPHVPVARIVAPAQHTWDDTARRLNDELFFDPWHSIADHRPLGSIMRVRRGAYRSSAEFRLVDSQ